MQIRDYWCNETATPGSEKVHVSPCGRFRLTVQRHTTAPGRWDYSSGLVEEVLEPKDGEKPEAFRYRSRVAFVKRNYGAFPFCWFTKGGDTHLIYGEDYQGYGVIHCPTGARADFRPKGYRQGFGFCHAELSWDAEQPTRLTTVGCFWACSYERVVYDISNPFAFPWPELSREDEEPEEDDDDHQEAP